MQHTDFHVRRRERVAAGSSSPRLSGFQSLSWILRLLPVERGGCSSGAVGSTRWDVWMVIDMWPYHISISTNLLKKKHALRYTVHAHTDLYVLFSFQMYLFYNLVCSKCRKRYSIYGRMAHTNLNNPSRPPSFFPTFCSAFPPSLRPSLLPVSSIIHKLKASP